MESKSSKSGSFVKGRYFTSTGSPFILSSPKGPCHLGFSVFLSLLNLQVSRLLCLLRSTFTGFELEWKDVPRSTILKIYNHCVTKRNGGVFSSRWFFVPYNIHRVLLSVRDNKLSKTPKKERLRDYFLKL